jgi:hypothetical protein
VCRRVPVSASQVLAKLKDFANTKGLKLPDHPKAVSPGGALHVPPDPDVLGWWQGGPRPGTGSARPSSTGM